MRKLVFYRYSRCTKATKPILRYYALRFSERSFFLVACRKTGDGSAWWSSDEMFFSRSAAFRNRKFLNLTGAPSDTTHTSLILRRSQRLYYTKVCRGRPERGTQPFRFAAFLSLRRAVFSAISTASHIWRTALYSFSDPRRHTSSLRAFRSIGRDTPASQVQQRAFALTPHCSRLHMLHTS